MASSSAVRVLCRGKTSSTLPLMRSSGAERSGTRCAGSGIAVELVDRADEGMISELISFDASGGFDAACQISLTQQATGQRRTLDRHHEILGLDLDAARVEREAVRRLVDLRIAPLDRVEGGLGAEGLWVSLSATLIGGAFGVPRTPLRLASHPTSQHSPACRHRHNPS